MNAPFADRRRRSTIPGVFARRQRIICDKGPRHDAPHRSMRGPRDGRRRTSGDDAHGAPIMIAAEKAGKTPQQFVAEIAADRKRYLDGYYLQFDHWHSTDSAENVELSQSIYRALKASDLIASRDVEQFFDPVK